MIHSSSASSWRFFFFNDTATTEIYTLSLHDALPILPDLFLLLCAAAAFLSADPENVLDRKSTRLNSSHLGISYAVFCLKKKKNTQVQSCSKKIRLPKTHKKPRKQ